MDGTIKTEVAKGDNSAPYTADISSGSLNTNDIRKAISDVGVKKALSATSTKEAASATTSSSNSATSATDLSAPALVQRDPSFYVRQNAQAGTFVEQSKPSITTTQDAALKTEPTVQKVAQENTSIVGAAKTTQSAGLFSSVAMGAVKGIWFVFKEFTGLGDLIEAGKCALRGEWGMAAMHFAMGAASAAMLCAGVAATIASGGLAGAPAIAAIAALRAGVKVGAKTAIKASAAAVLRHEAKAIGEKAVASLGKEVLDAAAKQSVENGVKALVSQGEVALKNMTQKELESALRSSMKQSAEKAVVSTLKKAEVDRLIENETLNLLKQAEKKSVKELAEEIEKMGLKEIKNAKDAKNAAKELKALVQSGKADKEIMQLLEDGISEPITQYMRNGMKESFELELKKALSGELKDESSQILAKVVKANGHDINALVNAGWEGASEGIESGVRKVVREAIENAFKKFRKKNRDLDLGSPNENANSNNRLSTATEDAAKRSTDKKVAEDFTKKAAAEAGLTKPKDFHRDVTTLTGERVRQYIHLEGDNKEIVTGSEILSMEAPSATPKPKV